MTEEEFRAACWAEVPRNLRKLAELAENPKASAAIRRKAATLLRQTLERLLAAGNC